MSPPPFIGVVRPEEMLDILLGEGSKPTSGPPTLDLTAVPGGNAMKMCAEFIRNVEKSQICPSLRLFIPRPKPKAKAGQPRSSGDTDGSDDILPTIGVRKQSTPHKRKRQSRRTDFRDHYNFATGLLAIDVSEDPVADPFVDPYDYMPSGSTAPIPPLCEHRPLQRSTVAAKNALESFTSRAHSHFLRQHRTHYWQVILFGSTARILRWDHAGAAVSERFNYTVHSELIATFLWRFAHVDDARRGFDTTASLPSKEETGLFVSAVREFLHNMSAGVKDGAPVRQLTKARCTLDEDTKTWPTWKMHVTNPDTGSATDLIVRRAFVFHRDVFSRATRAYIAYDLGARRLVFVKDSWRLARRFPEPEFRTLQQLLAQNIPHVPAALYGGDVCEPGDDGVPGPEHATTNQRFLADTRNWSHPDAVIIKHMHHRIVQDIVYPIDENVSPRDFVQALYDALIALDAAHSKLGLTHRDISSGNIMIASDGRGLLIDWENAGGERDKTSWSGTWAFVSVLRGLYPSKLRDLPDDLESIFWLLLYNGFKFYSFGRSHLTSVFDNFTKDEHGHKFCGFWKVRWMYVGLEWSGQCFRSPILEELILCANNAWVAAYLGKKALLEGRQVEPDVHANIARVGEPRFWIEMFKNALEKFDASAKTKNPDWGLKAPAQRSPFPSLPRQPPVKQENPSEGIAPRRTKRRAEDELLQDGGYGPECPRRSKRLRTKANLE